MAMSQEKAERVMQQAIEQAIDFIVSESDNPTLGYNFILNMSPVGVSFGSSLTRSGYKVMAGLVNNKNVDRTKKAFNSIFGEK